MEPVIILLGMAFSIWFMGPDRFDHQLALRGAQIHRLGVAILDHFFPPMIPKEPVHRELGWVLRQFNEQRIYEKEKDRGYWHSVPGGRTSGHLGRAH